MIYSLHTFLLLGSLFGTSAGPNDSSVTMNTILVTLTGEPTRTFSDDQLNEFCHPCLYVIKRYGEEEKAEFMTKHRNTLWTITNIIDSINAFIPSDQCVNELVLWRGVGNMYKSQLVGNKLHLAMGYLFLYGDSTPLRAAILHEMGHAIFDGLPEKERNYFEMLWQLARNSNLLGFFKEGLYPKAIPIFGHPGDSADELFASTFAILNLYQEEFVNKLAGASLSSTKRSLVLHIQTYVRRCIN